MEFINLGIPQSEILPTAMKPKKLLVFDIDGTIIDTQNAEGECYAQAILDVTGISLASVDWSLYSEPTSSGILRGLLTGHANIEAIEQAVKAVFVERLRQAQPHYPDDFLPIPGVEAFITQLKEQGEFDVAIATGGFDTEAAFKLQCCGFHLPDFPHATSSDTPARRDIIPLAIARAGYSLEAVVYFGDAPWDLTATQALGIPMIGIGRRIEQLSAQGLVHTFRDYRQPEFLLETIAGFL